MYPCSLCSNSTDIFTRISYSYYKCKHVSGFSGIVHHFVQVYMESRHSYKSCYKLKPDKTFLRWTKMWAKTIPLCHSRFYEMLYLSITTNYARVRWEQLIGICIWIGRVDCTSLCVKPEESVGMFIPLLLYASNYFACTFDKCLSITEFKKKKIATLNRIF